MKIRQLVLGVVLGVLLLIATGCAGADAFKIPGKSSLDITRVYLENHGASIVHVETNKGGVTIQVAAHVLFWRDGFQQVRKVSFSRYSVYATDGRGAFGITDIERHGKEVFPSDAVLRVRVDAQEKNGGKDNGEFPLPYTPYTP